MKLLNREAVKYIAIILMLMDHVIKIFCERGTFSYNLLHGLSHFTFVSMSFFLVEGFRYTKSKSAYVKRIFLFAIISQVPYAMAFSLGIIPLNVLFTLGFCFLMLWAWESRRKTVVKALVLVLCFIGCTFSDWTIYAPVFTLAFYWAKGRKERLVFVYAFQMLCFGGMNISGYLMQGQWLTAGMEFVISSSGILLSGICILCLYNGKCMERGRHFNKWFFYIFYPAHLLVLAILAMV